MAISDADMRRIAELVRTAVEDLRSELESAGGYAGSGQGGEVGQEAATALAPLTRAVGSWNLASTRTGNQEAAAPNAPVDFDRFENNLHAGGRVMVTTFSGRFREGFEAGGTPLPPNRRFGGFFALAYDASNSRYIQLYADDAGKVAYNTAGRWEVDGDTLRLFYDEQADGSGEASGYVAEFVTEGPARLTYNLYEARGGGGSTESARGNLIKAATLQRQ